MSVGVTGEDVRPEVKDRIFIHQDYVLSLLAFERHRQTGDYCLRLIWVRLTALPSIS